MSQEAIVEMRQLLRCLDQKIDDKFNEIRMKIEASEQKIQVLQKAIEHEREIMQNYKKSNRK